MTLNIPCEGQKNTYNHKLFLYFQMLEEATIFQVRLVMFALIGLTLRYSKPIEWFLTHHPHQIRQNLKYSTSVRVMMDFIDVGSTSKCRRHVPQDSISRLQVRKISISHFTLYYHQTLFHSSNQLILNNDINKRWK